MQTSKQQLIALLKRTGSVTVEEAAGALAVASMTARQHLVGLERDGLVLSEKVRRSMGRPHYLYSLTAKGQEMFPQRFDLFASILLDEVGRLRSGDIDGLEEDEKRSLLIMRTRTAWPSATASTSKAQPGTARLGRDGRPAPHRRFRRVVRPMTVRDRDYNCVFARLMPLETSAASVTSVCWASC